MIDWLWENIVDIYDLIVELRDAVSRVEGREGARQGVCR